MSPIHDLGAHEGRHVQLVGKSWSQGWVVLAGPVIPGP